MESRRDRADRLTSAETLTRSAVLSVVGTVLPLLAGLAAVPVLLEFLGPARLGLLSLAWTLAGTFSILDFGLGRALTQAVARAIGEDRGSELPGLFWSYVALLAVGGLIASLITALASAWLVSDVLRIPSDLHTEARTAFLLLAGAVPLVMISVGFRGFLEAHQRFDMVAAVRVPTTLLMFLGPAAIAPFWDSLIAAMVLLVASRALAFAAHFWQCLVIVPELRRFRTPAMVHVRALARFGGWITLNNTIAPILVYIDRFIIGAVISAAAVAYYATPTDVMVRLTVIPLALVPVVFPAFAMSFATDVPRTARLLSSTTNYVVLLMLVPVVLAVGFSADLLDLWLGATFAEESALVMQLIACGALFNGAAQAPLALLQGVGRPDLGAKLQLAEIGVYLPAVWLLIDMHGIEGAAAAWLARVAVDAVGLFLLAQRLLPGERVVSVRLPALVALALGAGVVLALAPIGLAGRIGLASVGAGLLVAVGWIWILDVRERSVLAGMFALESVRQKRRAAPKTLD